MSFDIVALDTAENNIFNKKETFEYVNVYQCVFLYILNSVNAVVMAMMEYLNALSPTLLANQLLKKEVNRGDLLLQLLLLLHQAEHLLHLVPIHPLLHLLVFLSPLLA